MWRAYRDLKIFLAGTSTRPTLDIEESENILESFYTIRKWQLPIIKKKNFLLDSGAFTFMNGRDGQDLDAYLDKYIEFINKYDVRKFFELDVDVVKGLQWVEQSRRKLERETGKKCIPVWHVSRGGAYFEELCRSYDYVAVGGIVTREIKRSQYEIFRTLIKIAHKNKCRIHGLGLTSMNALREYHFDSVDSTSWLSGGKYGQLHFFKNGRIEILKKEGKRVKDCKQIDNHNFGEWCKFQKYADEYL